MTERSCISRVPVRLTSTSRIEHLGSGVQDDQVDLQAHVTQHELIRVLNQTRSSPNNSVVISDSEPPCRRSTKTWPPKRVSPQKAHLTHIDTSSEQWCLI